MKRSLFGSLAVFAMMAGIGCGRHVTGPAGDPTPIEVAQGDHVKLPVLTLPATEWCNLTGPDAGYVSRNATYHAPLTLSSERSVTLEAIGEGWTQQIHVLLKPGPVERSDCLAPGQPEVRDDPSAYAYVEELPDAIVRVPPSYPDAARIAGVEGTVVLKAFVCACGEVADVEIVNSIPLLDQASVDAVRQWIFVPALTNGEPVAVWVVIPVRFSLH